MFFMRVVVFLCLVACAPTYAIDGGPADAPSDAVAGDLGTSLQDTPSLDAPLLDARADAGDLRDAPDASSPDAAEDAPRGDASVVSPFDATYVGWDERAIGGADTPYAIVGREPMDGARHPVFVFLIGTAGAHDSPPALAWIDAMAERGFVAGSVEYDNDVRFGCRSLIDKAAGIAGDADSALAVLCARPTADCTRGIVLAGHSQGSFMALLARDHDARVRAVLALGTGANLVGPGADHTSCLITSRVLPATAIRATNGESDGSFGAFASMLTQLDTITGSGCGTTALSCLRGDGSGWTVAPDGEVTDGTADHCYYSDDGGGGMSCTAPLDPVWLTGAAPWARSAGADWLAAQVTP